jgi:phage baseplate assembly protein W
MAKATIPHFAFPARFDASGHLATVEQDSLDDVAACVEATLRTRVGERVELPQFGVFDLAFRQQPVPLEQLVAQVVAWEPRAQRLATDQPERVGEIAARVLQITVST